MNSTSRTLASFLTVAASSAVGIIGARAINSDNSGADPTSPIVIDTESPSTPVDDVVTIPTETTAGSIGATGIPIAVDATSAGARFVDDPIAGVQQLPQPAFDSCAGSSPDEIPQPGCPPGYAGVLSGDMPPAPWLWGTYGRYLTAPGDPFPEACPPSTPTGADHNAITVFSRTPLESLTVRWIPYGTTYGPWASITAPGTPEAERIAWMARFEAEDYSREAFGYLTLCGIHIDREPNTAYEVVLEAIDSFGRPVTSRSFVMPDGTPSGRPPTEAFVVGRWIYIDAWAPAGGSARFAMRTVTDPEDHACPAEGEGVISHSTVRDDQLFVSPFGVYSPQYSRKISTWVEVPPGQLAVICTSIYTAVSTVAYSLDPIATDTHLARGEPVATWRIRGWQVITASCTEETCPGGDPNFDSIPANTFAVTIGTAAEGCGVTIYNDELNDEQAAALFQWAPLTDVSCQAPIRDWRADPYMLPITVRRLVDGVWVDDYGTGFLSLGFQVFGNPPSYHFTEYLRGGWFPQIRTRSGADYPSNVRMSFLREVESPGVVYTTSPTVVLVASTDR